MAKQTQYCKNKKQVCRFIFGQLIDTHVLRPELSDCVRLFKGHHHHLSCLLWTKQTETKNKQKCSQFLFVLGTKSSPDANAAI